MENAVDALHMATAVLIFVLALSISINAFGEVRQTSQIILDNRDREYDYTYVENNGTTERIVSAETIIPSIYKAYKENYKIVFLDRNENGIELYKKYNKSVYSIDPEESLNDETKEQFIKAFLYGTKYPDEILNLKSAGIYLNGTNFYDTRKGKTFTEKLGVYYQEEITEESNTPNTNKNKKRVITYVEN